MGGSRVTKENQASTATNDGSEMSAQGSDPKGQPKFQDLSTEELQKVVAGEGSTPPVLLDENGRPIIKPSGDEPPSREEAEEGDEQGDREEIER